MPPTRMLVKTTSAHATHSATDPQSGRRVLSQPSAARPCRCREARLVHVVERNLFDREIGSGQAADEQRRPNTGPAYDRDLHSDPPGRPAPACLTCEPNRQSEHASWSPSGLRADEVTEPEALARSVAIEPGGEESAVERIAGAGGIDARTRGAGAATASPIQRLPRRPSLIRCLRAPPVLRRAYSAASASFTNTKSADSIRARETRRRRAAAGSTRSPTTSSRRVAAADRRCAIQRRQSRGAKARWTWRAGWRAIAAGSRASRRSLTPLNVTKLRSLVVDSDTVTACASAGALDVDDADAIAAQRARGFCAERADDGGLQSEARRRGRRDHARRRRWSRRTRRSAAPRRGRGRCGRPTKIRS